MAPHVETSGDEYGSGTVIQDEARRDAVRRTVGEARRQQSLREQAEAEAHRQAWMKRERQQVARTPGERLLDHHVHACHTLESVLESRHTRPGSWLVLQRTRWLHGAEIPNAAATPIVSHLAAERSPTTVRGWPRANGGKADGVPRQTSPKKKPRPNVVYP